MGNNIGTTIVVIFLVSIIMGGLYFISGDISKNPNLDDASITILSDINSEYSTNLNNKNVLNFSESNSTFEGVDPFSRQYLEDKTEINSKKSTVNKILTFPGLFIKLFGVESNTIILAWSSLVYSLLVFLISLQIYKAARTGETD